ncbi:MAG: US12 family protein [Planctomycetes bacterium]|nr:US12 family protein [Planctomycetota bacterium]
MAGYQPQSGIRVVWDEGVEARASFIQKTYAHLFAAIILFVAFEIVLFKSGVAARIAAPMAGRWYLVLGGFMLVSWGASRLAFTTASLPAQYAALIGFIIVEALIFVPLLYLANRAAGGVIQNAAIVTFGGFTALTAVAFVTRKDFSFLRGVVMWGGLCAVLAIVSGLVFGFQLGTWFSVGMVALAGAAILYDTSNVLHRYPHDRYVGASLALFASVALMFWFVLRIFISRD